MEINRIALNQQDGKSHHIPSSSSHQNTLQFKSLASCNHHEKVQTNQLPWNEHAIVYLNGVDTYLDKKIPDNNIQLSLDAIGNSLEELFAPLKPFNDWLDRREKGTWLRQLALFLVKLPASAVRNVIRLVYNLIKSAIYTVVHPLKAVNRLAKMLIALVQELTKPEVWAKMGIGMMGTSLGQAAISGNPLSVIGLGIGAAFLIGGISATAINVAVEAENGFKLEAVKKSLLSLAKQLPEAAATGLVMGLLLGSIQRATKFVYKPSDKQIQHYADSFVKKHNLPKPSYILRQELPDGTISIKFEWNSLKELQQLKESHPQLFTGDYVRSITVRLNPDAGQIIIDKAKFYNPDSLKIITDSSWVRTHPSLNPPYTGRPVEFPTLFSETKPLEALGIHGYSYPTALIDRSFEQYGVLGGAAASLDKPKLRADGI